MMKFLLIAFVIFLFPTPPCLGGRKGGKGGNGGKGGDGGKDVVTVDGENITVDNEQ